MALGKDREDYDYKIGARDLTLWGVLDALGQSPIVNNLPPVLRAGTMDPGRNVRLDNGDIINVEQDNKTPNVGSRVVVFESAKTCFEK